MTPFEWLAVIYFVALALARARSPRRRGHLYAAGAVLLVIVARFAAPWEVRAWLTHAYLMLGYWIPAAFTVRLNDRFERWLCAIDETLLGSWVSGVGSWRAAHALEMAYLLCYPMVPTAFTIVFVLGTRADVTRFWIAVLLGGYACYGTLPWTAARPPRTVAADEPTRRGLAKLNTLVLRRVSHTLNTFPSGHVAVALAAALAVQQVSFSWGAVLLVMALTIAVAAVAGRYHYLLDVLAGLGTGAVGWAMANYFVQALPTM